MLNRAEVLQAILDKPLDYLHPHRGVLPVMFDNPSARTALNQMLLRKLGLASTDPHQLERNFWTEQWIKNWSLLPSVARLMGAQLLWPQLAKGARMFQLEPQLRAFARVDLGHRAPGSVSDKVGLDQSIAALGLGALLAWDSHIPQALMERMLLQFAPAVVTLEQSLQAQKPNSSLFILAVQHARIHQNAD